MRSTSTEVDSVFTTLPVMPLSSTRWRRVRREDAVRVHELAVAVARADAVGVAVGDEARVEAGVEHGARISSIHGGIGSGCRPPKPGLGSPWISTTSTPRRRKHRGEVGLAGAVERVDDDVEVRGGDDVGVDEVDSEFR